jgi:antitoxin (DNA-binding transcriptional repressor) of toxin-antitoxin stability system
MESKVTAIEMRKKFGSILDRVVEKGEHITIMRGNLPLATLIPAQEHERQCSSNQKIKTIEEALLELEAWKKKNPTIVKKLAGTDSTEIIRKMRGSRWSSSTPRSR